MDRRKLIDSDVTMIELALTIARDTFSRHIATLANDGDQRLKAQFERQRDHAEALRLAVENYPDIILEYQYEDA